MILALRILVFVCIELAFIPLQMLGVAGYTLKVWARAHRGVSGTAYEPLWVRLLMHLAGTRDDEATFKLAPCLPALSPTIVWLVAGTAGLASRLSGFRGAVFAYPISGKSSLATIINHRTTFIDDALAQAVDPKRDRPVEQVVFLGAGWDTRAHVSLAALGMEVFEVDMPATQAAKRSALVSAGIETAHVTFVETDFDQRTWLDALLEHGFDPTLPTFIIWEGVTTYLDPRAVEAVLKQVSELAPGSRIVFEFLSHELVHAEAPFALLGRVARFGMKYYDEPLVFGISTKTPARQQVDELLGSQGLMLEAYQPLGEESERRTPHGGLAVALVPD